MLMVIKKQKISLLNKLKVSLSVKYMQRGEVNSSNISNQEDALKIKNFKKGRLLRPINSSILAQILLSISSLIPMCACACVFVHVYVHVCHIIF